MSNYTHKYHSNPEFKEKRLAQTRKWGRSERGRKAKRKWYDEHIGTERGYLLDRWYNLTSRVNRKNRKKVSLDITRKEFFELWEEHKKHHGWNCAYTGKLMTRTRSMNELNLTSKDLLSGKNSLQKVRTNMSVDRIDSDKGYTKDNITFCTWDFNDRKGNISVADIRCILELIESRK